MQIIIGQFNKALRYMFQSLPEHEVHISVLTYVL